MVRPAPIEIAIWGVIALIIKSQSYDFRIKVNDWLLVLLFFGCFFSVIEIEKGTDKKLKNEIKRSNVYSLKYM